MDALPLRVRDLNNEDRFENGDWLTIHRSHAVKLQLRVPCSWCPSLMATILLAYLLRSTVLFLRLWHLPLVHLSGAR